MSISRALFAAFAVPLALCAAPEPVLRQSFDDDVSRPKVESRGEVERVDGMLALTATSPGRPFNVLWAPPLETGALYRVSYAMKADAADGFGGVFAAWDDPVPRADGLRYDVWRETHDWGCTNGSGKMFALYDDAWRLAGGIPLRTDWTDYSFFLEPDARMERPVLAFSLRAAATNTVRYRAFRLEKVARGQELVWRNVLFETRKDGGTVLRPAGAQRAEATIPGTPGEHLRVTFEITNDGAPGELRTFDAALEDGTRVLDEYVSESSLGGTWIRKTLEGRVPATGRMTLSIFVYNGDSHAVSMPDRVVLRNVAVARFTPRAVPKVALSLSEPVYKRTVYATSPRRNIAGRVDVSGGGGMAKVALAAQGRTLATVETRGAFELPGTDALPEGTYAVTATLADGTAVTTGLRRVAASASEVSYRDGRMHFNGRPFFFSGIWGPPQYTTEALYYGHARNGLRVQLWGASPRTAEQLLKDLDLAAKYHSRLILDVQFAPGRFHEKGYFEQWEKDVRAYFSPQVRAHPALLGYYMCDEPGWGGVSLEALEAAYRTMDELDPYHPAWINEAPITSVKRLRRSLGACDAYGVDIYPVPASHAHSGLPDKEVTSVGGFARLFGELLAGTRPTWLVLQGTSWDAISEKANPVYPTREQMRFMSLDAMVHGTAGTIYWGMWYTRGKRHGPGNAPFYDGLLAAAKEVRALDALWLAGDTLALPRAEGVRTFAAELEGARWIVALNRTARPRGCAFPMEGLWVLPEGRPAVADDARLAGYTARVFASVPRYPTAQEPEIPFDAALEEGFRKELRAYLEQED